MFPTPFSHLNNDIKMKYKISQGNEENNSTGGISLMRGIFNDALQ